MAGMLKRFWDWYERNYALNASVTAGLFGLQLIHLYWLTTDVVMQRLVGQSFFGIDNTILESVLVLVDYTEIPAIVLTSVFYVNAIRQKRRFKDALYLFFLNTQWIHIFWITDEVVVNLWQGEGVGNSWHPAAAWLAILIDYLELPVIYEVIKEAVRTRSVKPILAAD